MCMHANLPVRLQRSTKHFLFGENVPFNVPDIFLTKNVPDMYWKQSGGFITIEIESSFCKGRWRVE